MEAECIHIETPDLIHISCEETGYTRKRRGRGFEYFDQSGVKVKDHLMLQRFKDLVIPPAWKDVWICPEENGYLQVTGKDEKGRKQYIYHKQWLAYRNFSKFEKMREFARVLTDIRKRIAADLRKRTWCREKVLALIVSILDESYLRIGNEYYARKNDTYGLTTLRRKHLEVDEAKINFQYKAKSGKYRKIRIENKKLVRLIKDCSELPGYEVFQYYDQDGIKKKVHSQDINEYLYEITRDHFTAKDFRTWGGTVLAVEVYEEVKKMTQQKKRKSLSTTLVKRVAAELGNTVSVCREYYIHPNVLNEVSREDFNLEKVQLKADKKYKRLQGKLDNYERIALFLMEQA